MSKNKEIKKLIINGIYNEGMLDDVAYAAERAKSKWTTENCNTRAIIGTNLKAFEKFYDWTGKKAPCFSMG